MAEVMAAPKMEPSMQLTPPQSSPQQHQYAHSQQQSLSQDGSPQSLHDLDDASALITPSANHPGMPMNSNASRRPPRKSTLTQQQKNQKRQRATQDQLMTLEVEFNKNPTPTALVRERIAQDINMTERSVQIWFQNRRAKIKNIAKRSIENGEDCDSIPESMRQYLVMQAYGPGGKGVAATMMNRNGTAFAPYGNGSMSLGGDGTANKTQIQHFACRSLSIGTWRRVGQSSMDLVIFYAPDKACVTYYINNDHAGYKIEYPFAWIKNISLEHGDVSAAAEGASQRSGGLIIELNHPPKFYMDSSGSGGFYECGDFTEDQQASQIMVHHLGGPSKVLSGQLAKLISLESYQNRASAFDVNPFAMPAQVPAPPMRPASQPNHLLHPHHGHGMQMYPQQHPVGLMGPPAPRGHKRQRSRSVPAAIDVSMLRGPMPSFLIQHHEGHPPPSHPPIHEHAIYAPVPQHQPNPHFAPGPGGLSIDTTAQYPMGIPFAGPISATTANSPSEFGTPAFYAHGPHLDNVAPPFATPYHNGFLAVDPAAMIGTSNTPLSVISHGDPVIADHSPPMNGLGRSQSADIFGTPGEHAQFGDDGLYLSESFNKQMRLPFRSPMPEDAFQSPMADSTFNFQSPTPALTNDGQMNAALENQARSMSFDGSVYQSPVGMPSGSQPHQDSGVAFSTPSHVSNEQAAIFQDNQMFSSPGQMHHLPDDQTIYHNSPLSHGMIAGDDIGLGAMGMYVDPHQLRNHP